MKNSWNHLHSIKWFIRDMFWQCLATFRINYSEEKSWNHLHPFKKVNFWHVLTMSCNFQNSFFRGKNLKSSTSPLKKYIFYLFWPCPTLFEILFLEDKNSWNHLNHWEKKIIDVKTSADFIVHVKSHSSISYLATCHTPHSKQSSYLLIFLIMFKVLAIIGALLAVLEAVKENNRKKIKTFLHVVY